MQKRKFSDAISGKGYYIALILCAVAIGITGYLYFRNANDTTNQLENPPASDVVMDGDVQTVATQPNDVTDPTQDGTEPTTKKPRKTVRPVSGETISQYAMDCLTYNQTTRDWRVHNGIDIAAEAGAEVFAAADGTVYTVYTDDTMGTTVVIRHEDGYVTKYASLSAEIAVTPGQKVSAGDVIGTVGNTALLESALGDHVHFSVTCNDAPVDPEQFLSQS